MTINITTTSWVLGGFLCLALFTLSVTVKAWRESKRSPYFFLRRQAEQKMLQYGSSSIILGMIAGAIALYGYIPNTDNITRMAVLESVKPDYDEALAMIESIDTESEAINISPAMVEATTNRLTANTQQPQAATVFSAPTDSVAPVRTLTNDLPAEYSEQFEPTAELQSGTNFGEIAFSDEINEFYEAIDPDRVFSARAFTLYATFAYEGMVDGMEWAWVWRHNGEVIDGGTQEWAYGEDGPGYVYLSPEEGFAAGQYTLQIWVNEEMQADANMIVTGAASR